MLRTVEKNIAFHPQIRNLDATKLRQDSLQIFRDRSMPKPQKEGTYTIQLPPELPPPAPLD